MFPYTVISNVPTNTPVSSSVDPVSFGVILSTGIKLIVHPEIVYV